MCLFIVITIDVVILYKMYFCLQRGNCSSVNWYRVRGIKHFGTFQIRKRTASPRLHYNNPVVGYFPPTARPQPSVLFLTYRVDSMVVKVTCCPIPPPIAFLLCRFEVRDLRHTVYALNVTCCPIHISGLLYSIPSLVSVLAFLFFPSETGTASNSFPPRTHTCLSSICSASKC